MSSKTGSDPYEQYSSKVKRVNIELPNYKFFHSPSREDKVDPRFIGHENLINRFKSIFNNSQTKTGAYLVTGYRGMGKSSFVSRVMNDITCRFRISFFWFWVLLILFFLAFCVSKILDYDKDIWYNRDWFIYTKNIIIWLALFCSLVGIRRLKKNCKYLLGERYKTDKENSVSIYGSIKNLFEKIKKLKKSISRIVLRLNLGHEILNEIDILSLIAANIKREFSTFAYSYRIQPGLYIFRNVLLIWLTLWVFNQSPGTNQNFRNLTGFSNLFPTQHNAEEFEKIVNTTQQPVFLSYLRNNCNGSITSFRDSLTYLDLKGEIDIKLHDSKYLFINNVVYSVNIVDIYIDAVFFYIQYFFNRNLFFGNKVVPQHINYLFFLLFFFFVFLYNTISKLILRSNYTVKTGRKSILNKLTNLNDQIDAMLQVESNIGSSVGHGGTGVTIGRKKTKNYPRAGVRQIEKGLIDILEDITHLPWILVKPEFIIIFDELDKLDPGYNTGSEDEEDEVPGFEGSTSGFSGGATTRARKQNVLRLLANMKYFITTAKAKFIFIAGRELYDAFLADVSDREFAISSIFHEVFYVESFLSDPSNETAKDITSMTEHYICQFLMTEDYLKKKGIRIKDGLINNLTIKTYYHYLKEKCPGYLDKEYDKVIFFLYQFIHYLTQVSNGAPKKITNFFEKYLVEKQQFDSKQQLQDSFIIRNKKAEGKFYLSFGVDDQCKIGFIHYLSNPIMQAIVNNIGYYGDKLLVSTTFLLDHIFKFHKNGFSWRNLEHVPEILEINRTPELRGFITLIIDYLKQTHISPIISGLYMFKFPNKLSEEISFISKLSEESSAIFNFTLDESLSVKRHYAKLLKYYTERYKSRQFNNQGDDYIHSIAEIHHILGDLHLLDEEYTEAIFEYYDSVQTVQKSFDLDNSPKMISNILHLVRTMLKLGLAFEKRKTFNSAYAIYSELVSLLIDFRFIDNKKFELQYKKEPLNNWISNKIDLFKIRCYNNLKNDTPDNKTMQDKFEESENKDITILGSSEEIVSKLAQHTTKLKNRIISRLSLFSDVRLMYQPLLAKLFVLEKNQTGGISKASMKVIEGEFINLYFGTRTKEKFLISSDFFKKVGDIMYYKNGLIQTDNFNLFERIDIWGYDISDDVELYCYSKDLNFQVKTILENIKESDSFDKPVDYEIKNITREKSFKGILLDSVEQFVSEWINKQQKSYKSEKDNLVKKVKDFFENGFNPPGYFTLDIVKKICNCKSRREELKNNGIVAPCYACKYYSISLRILAENLINEDCESDISKSMFFLKALGNRKILFSERTDYMQTLASVLGGFGDILVSCSTKANIDENFLKIFFSYAENCEGKNHYDRFESLLNKYLEKNDLSNLEKAMLYYFASANYYRRSSHMKEEYFMYKKIVQLISEFILLSPSKVYYKNLIIDIERILIKKALESMYIAYDLLHISEIQELKWHTSLQLYEELKLHNLSILPDLEELLYSFYELKLTFANENSSLLKSLLNSTLLSPYRLNNSVYNRLQSLLLKARINKEWLKKILPDYDFNNAPFSADHAKQFYKAFSNNKPFIGNPEISNVESFYLELEHLIIDSIFCLQKFCEIITPRSKTALFTNSYIAGIYEDLFVWSQLFDFTFICYSYFDDKHLMESNESKKENILKKLGKYNKQLDVQGQILKNRKIKTVVEDYNEFIKERTDELSGQEDMQGQISKNKKIKTLVEDYRKFLEEQRIYNFIKTDVQRQISKNKIIDILVKDYKKFLKRRIGELSEQSGVQDQIYVENYKKFLEERIDTLLKEPVVTNKDLIDNMIKQLKKYGELLEGRTDMFFEKFIRKIGKNSTHYINSNYMAEMAKRYYRNAKQVHSEGKAYKNMIEDMYLVDDDLDNDSLKFYLALERYRINTGIVDDNYEKLKNINKDSSLYKIDRYVTV
jgi:hypothetical protein